MTSTSPYNVSTMAGIKTSPLTPRLVLFHLGERCLSWLPPNFSTPSHKYLPTRLRLINKSLVKRSQISNYRKLVYRSSNFYSLKHLKVHQYDASLHPNTLEFISYKQNKTILLYNHNTTIKIVNTDALLQSSLQTPFHCANSESQIAFSCHISRFLQSGTIPQSFPKFHDLDIFEP